jgi:FKBP-type peptidyl-prolyl cis-trans isomerase (trigger factor)
MANVLTNVNVSRDEKAWEVELKAEIPSAVLDMYRDEALKEMQKTAKLDGFRPGKAPLERIVEVYGEAAIMREAAEHAIQHTLPELLAEQKFLIIEAPKVTTDTPVKGKPLVFTARAPLAPEVKLPDYKKIAAKQPLPTADELKVTDEEHKEALTHLQRERARIDKLEKGTEPEKAAEEVKAMKEEELPALDDEFVQSLGYENAAKFTETVRTNMTTEKEMQAKEKRRTAILDEIVKGATISYPSKLLEYELDDMEARMQDDLTRMGATYEGYLQQTKKTREDIRGGWKDAADKRSKIRLILTEIARAEKIEPDEAQLKQEIEHAKEHYPQADAETLRVHIAHAMRNDAVLKFLESIAA